MNKYQCWFCEQGIDSGDTGAVLITIESLWRWDSGVVGKDDPLQAVYAHADCAMDRLKGATMTIEPGIFGEDG